MSLRGDNRWLGHHSEKFGQYSSSRELYKTPIYWVIRHEDFHAEFIVTRNGQNVTKNCVFGRFECVSMG